VGESERLLAEVVGLRPLAGAGFTSLAPDPRNTPVLRRLCAALGLL
jgi:hypothetical protein